MKCKKHPKYKGICKPKVDCEKCKYIYEKHRNIYRHNYLKGGIDDGYDTHGGGIAPLEL